MPEIGTEMSVSENDGPYLHLVNLYVSGVNSKSVELGGLSRSVSLKRLYQFPSPPDQITRGHTSSLIFS